jgi:DNA-binding NarL/FixJ family response regulator
VKQQAGEGRSFVRVVLAEPQVLFRDALAATMERESRFHVAGVAGDAERALAEVARHRPDIVILAGDLPSEGGVHATREIRGRVPETRVLIVGPEGDQSLLIAALEAGVGGYLTKGSPLDDLICATLAVHEGDMPIPPSMLPAVMEELIGRRRQARDDLRLVSRLTPREREVLTLLSGGGNNQAIARALVISPQTARTHVQHLLAKLGVHSRLAAAAFAMRDGVLEALGHFDDGIGARSEEPRLLRAPAAAMGGMRAIDQATRSGAQRQAGWG